MDGFIVLTPPLSQGAREVLQEALEDLMDAFLEDLHSGFLQPFAPREGR